MIKLEHQLLNNMYFTYLDRTVHSLTPFLEEHLFLSSVKGFFVVNKTVNILLKAKSK